MEDPDDAGSQSDLTTPPSPYIKARQVARGFDVADDYIVQQSTAGDLVITADIPLASELIAKQAYVLNPRGERYTADTIAELTIRDMMADLRDSGVDTGGPRALSQADRRAFANELDRLLARLAREAKK